MEGKKSTRLPTTFSFQKFWRGVAAFCFSQTAASLVLLRCAVRSVFISCPSRHYHTQLSWDIRVYAPVRFFSFFYTYLFACGLISLCTPGRQIHISTFHVLSVATGADLNVARLWRQSRRCHSETYEEMQVTGASCISCKHPTVTFLLHEGVHGNHIVIWRLRVLPLCFSRLVTSLTGTAQTKASDICISSSHHGLCSALTELTNGVWSWRLWTNQTVGGDGEADERRRYRCSNLAEALETACLLDPAPPKKSAARACPTRLQLIQEVIPLWAADRDRLLWLFYFLTSAINFNGQASALCSWRFFTRLRQHDCVILLLVMNWQELCVFYCNCLAL